MSFADWTPEELAEFDTAVEKVIAERSTMPKRRKDMTPAEEAAAWDRGDFADGTWVDVTPEASHAANERMYYRTGEDGVRRHLIRCSCNRDGCTYARGSSSARVFLAGGPWLTLNSLQKDSLCQLVWRVKSGDFILLDAVTDDVIATHTIQASKEQPGFESQGSD